MRHFLVLVQFEKIRRRRSLISAQWLERSDNPGNGNVKTESTLKALGMCCDNPFRVQRILMNISQGCRSAPTTGLKLANAFGV